jgi:hypothetical protein
MSETVRDEAEGAATAAARVAGVIVTHGQVATELLTAAAK